MFTFRRSRKEGLHFNCAAAHDATRVTLCTELLDPFENEGHSFTKEDVAFLEMLDVFHRSSCLCGCVTCKGETVLVMARRSKRPPNRKTKTQNSLNSVIKGSWPMPCCAVNVLAGGRKRSEGVALNRCFFSTGEPRPLSFWCFDWAAATQDDFMYIHKYVRNFSSVSDATNRRKRLQQTCPVSGLLSGRVDTHTHTNQHWFSVFSYIFRK